MQNGVDKWDAAGFLGMSVEMLDRVYGHHHPEHLRGAAHALGYRRSQSLAITLAPGRRPRPLDRQSAGNIGGPGSCPTSSNLNYLSKLRLNRGALKLQDDFFATRTTLGFRRPRNARVFILRNFYRRGSLIPAKSF